MSAQRGQGPQIGSHANTPRKLGTKSDSRTQELLAAGWRAETWVTRAEAVDFTDLHTLVKRFPDGSSQHESNYRNGRHTFILDPGTEPESLMAVFHLSAVALSVFINGPICFIGDVLFAANGIGDKLETVDPLTGVVTHVGNVNQFDVGERATGGIAHDSAGSAIRVHMVGGTNDALYRLSTTNGGGGSADNPSLDSRTSKLCGTSRPTRLRSTGPRHFCKNLLLSSGIE